MNSSDPAHESAKSQNKGLVRKTLTWFSLTDGRELTVEDLAALKEAETARSQALERSASVEEPGPLPHYSWLKTNPCPGLPPDLKARQQSDAFTARRKEFQRDILDSAEHPRDDFTLFIVLLIDRRPVTISVPESSAQSLFVFSTRVHAHDYVRTLLTSAPRVQHDGATPSQLVGLLRTLKQVGIDSFTVDHCPRCRVLSTILSDSITEVSDIVKIWGMRRAFVLAWTELYMAYAVESARSGRLDVARDVALESVGHVTMEDPRPHLLLGQLAVLSGDQILLLEAKAFLKFFRFLPWERKLEEAERSGSTDFNPPG